MSLHPPEEKKQVSSLDMYGLDGENTCSRCLLRGDRRIFARYGKKFLKLSRLSVIFNSPVHDKYHTISKRYTEEGAPLAENGERWPSVSPPGKRPLAHHSLTLNLLLTGAHGKGKRVFDTGLNDAGRRIIAPFIVL